MELYDLHDRKFKITVIKLLTEVKRIMHEHSKNFKNRNYLKRAKNTMSKLKKSPMSSNNRLY